MMNPGDVCLGSQNSNLNLLHKDKIKKNIWYQSAFRSMLTNWLTQ